MPLSLKAFHIGKGGVRDCENPVTFIYMARGLQNLKKPKIQKGVPTTGGHVWCSGIT